MNKKIQTAVVGYGLSGKAFHAPFLHQHEGFSLSKVVERNKAESRKDYPYVTVVDHLKEVLHDDAIDLVVLCTPNIHHFDQAKQCLEAGKHVVIEKPFMNTTGECDRIISLAKKAGKHVFVYQNRRWDGDFMTIRKIIRTGVLGDLKFYEAHFDRYSPERKRAAWRDEELPGSGILFDLGPHLIDQALVLFGPPSTIKADVQAQRNGSPVDDYFRLHLAYPGKEVILTAGMLVEDNRLRYILHGTTGSFIKYGIDPQEAILRQGAMPGGESWGQEATENYGLITLDDESEDFDGIVETLPGNYMGFYDNVYNVIVKGEKMAVTPEEARNVIKLIELAFESSRSNSTLEVKF